MATEFEPTTRKTTAQDPMARVNDPMIDKPRSNMAPYGIAAVVAVALALGLMFWGMNDRNAASVNTAPGMTTGSSSMASPSNPPPAPGIQQGQGQSNSTR